MIASNMTACCFNEAYGAPMVNTSQVSGTLMKSNGRFHGSTIKSQVVKTPFSLCFDERRKKHENHYCSLLKKTQCTLRIVLKGNQHVLWLMHKQGQNKLNLDKQAKPSTKLCINMTKGSQELIELFLSLLQQLKGFRSTFELF